MVTNPAVSPAEERTHDRGAVGGAEEARRRDDRVAAGLEHAVSPRDLADHNWISVGAISGLFDLTRETLDQLGLPQATPILENTGDVTMTFRILETTKSCSMLPFRLLGTMQNRYRIAPVDLTIPLPSRHVGLWTAASVRVHSGPSKP